MNKYSERRSRPVGAGGTEGGIGRFLLGMVMMIGGVYLLLSNIHVGSNWGGLGGFGRSINIGGRSLTSGFLMIPFMFGVGLIFYNSRSYIGWFLAFASIIALIFGVITNIQFHFYNLNVLELIIILVLFVGGIGLFLSSLRSSRSQF